MINLSSVGLPGMHIIGKSKNVVAAVLPQACYIVLEKDGSVRWISSCRDAQQDPEAAELVSWLGAGVKVSVVSSTDGEPAKPNFPMPIPTFEVSIENRVSHSEMITCSTLLGGRCSVVGIANYMRLKAGNISYDHADNSATEDAAINKACEPFKSMSSYEFAISAMHHGAVLDLMKVIDRKRHAYLSMCDKMIELYRMLPCILASDDPRTGRGCVCFAEYGIVGWKNQKKVARKKKAIKNS